MFSCLPAVEQVLEQATEPWPASSETIARRVRLHNTPCSGSHCVEIAPCSAANLASQKVSRQGTVPASRLQRPSAPSKSTLSPKIYKDQNRSKPFLGRSTPVRL